MDAQHAERLARLDEKASSHHCTLRGRNVVDRIGITVGHVRLTVTVTRSRESGFLAATTIGSNIRSAWGRKASEAVTELGTQLRSELEAAI